LWREHLGESYEEGGSISGRLRLWRETARANIELLKSKTPQRALPFSRSLLLPYSVRSSPREQLAAMGVDLSSNFDLQFDPGWLEIHCSPNWIRNMFI
jgi:hypothetical protein